MVQKSDLRRVSDTLWELSSDYRRDMRVPARVYADNRIIDAIFEDKTGEQLVNMTTLPGAVGWAAAMPDAHQGYGFCIGGVLATELPDGVISPGGVGYDINCGVRLLRSELQEEEVAGHMPELMSAINQNCPSGVGTGGPLKVREIELDKLLTDGAKWMFHKGYARREDLEHTESHGQIPGANPDKVSKRAKQRGASQLGTLGAGNHFIEVDVVDEIYDQNAADAMGVRPGLVVVQIHTGSRGFGHQVASDYVKEFQKAIRKYGINLPDRELVCAPLNSPEGQSYFGAMCAAANYAFSNRQLLTHWVRASFEQVLAGYTKDFDLAQIYDIAHNIAKVESHMIGGRRVQVCVHRKGATRAFGPGFEELPVGYRSIGQPVLVPGSMGTASWILIGTEKSMQESFGSCCHGAGRTMSRSQAKRTVWGGELRERLESAGIVVRAGSMAGLAEEAPVAYKDVDVVVDIVDRAGLASRVARLRPIGVMKG
jgi:tRNA-splicing ligase RtcB